MISSVIAGLLGCLLVLAVGSLYLALRPVHQPSGHQGGHQVRLRCEGHCGGRTRHEDDGDGTATCTACGAPSSTTTEPDGA